MLNRKIEKTEDLHVTKIILGIGKINSCHVPNVVRFNENCLFMEWLVFMAFIRLHVISTTFTKIEFVGELILVVK